MHKWHLSNIRCQACANSIRRQMVKFPNVTNVVVNVEEKTLSFEAPDDALALVERRLARMGYVRDEHPEENGSLAVARSLMSCLAGKLT